MGRSSGSFETFSGQTCDPTPSHVSISTEIVSVASQSQIIFSEMMQQRWTKWKDDNGTYIVPYYFSKSFPGTE